MKRNTITIILVSVELTLVAVSLVLRDVSGARHCMEMVFLMMILAKLEYGHEL